MAKYNINEKKEKVAAYRSLVSPKMMDEMQEKIMNIIVMQKKYRDKDYSFPYELHIVRQQVSHRGGYDYSCGQALPKVSHGGSQRHGWILQSSVVLCFVLQSRGHHSEGVSPAAPQAASFYVGSQTPQNESEEDKGKVKGKDKSKG